MKNTARGRIDEADDNDEPARYISGQHLLDLADKPATTRVNELLGAERAGIVVEWHRSTIGHGRHIIDPSTGVGTPNPYVSDVLAMPVELIAELLADDGIDVPTRAQVRKWVEDDIAAGGDGVDPEIELMRAELVADPDLTTGPAERRICGVPESIFDTLETQEQQKVLGGLVIAPPQAPTSAARWLVRHVFSTRHRLPGRRRGRAWMRTLVRIDQTFYEYLRPGAGEPPRWIPRTDPEWIRARLRRELSGLWYVKTRREDKQNVYELKSWNPDDRGLTQVGNALADLLAAGTGTHARELSDVWGRQHAVYSGSTSALCRNGVLEVTTGHLLPNSPLWFSLTRIEADYNHASDPNSDCEWLKTLRAQWWDDPGAIACLQQWFGYVLSGRIDLQKFMLIVGPKGSAKSLIAEVLESLMGVIAELGLDALNSHFGLQQVYENGATLAVMADMRFGARDSSLAVSRLLAITGGDTVSIDRKNKAPVSARLQVRLHGSANEIPRLSDHSGALGSRMLILETTRVFRGTADDDPGLKKRILVNELGFVLRWAVEGLAALNAAGGVFTLSARADELAEEVADEFSNVRQFVRECCTIGDADNVVGLPELFRVFGKWAETRKSGERMSQNAFQKALKSMHEGPIRPGQKKDSGQRVVYGIKFAETNYVHRDRFGNEFPYTVTTEENACDFPPTGRIARLR